MKNFKTYLAGIAVFAMLFTSCSKDGEESSLDDPNAETATLSFGAVLNDLKASNSSLKQAMDIPVCSDADPAYVSIILTHGGGEVVGTMADPFEIDLVNGEFTEEVPELELMPGNYSLDHFEVFDASHNRIWVAPKTGGELANFVDDALPMDISLGAVVKKYVDVPVLCFDDRMVNEYGYLFFDLSPENAVEFCFFANYCDESGRHFTAAYSVDVWVGTSSAGTLLYSDVENEARGMNQDGDYYAEPLCFAFPDLASIPDDQDYLYYEVTLMDWEGNYGEVAPAVISGTLNRNDIAANFDGPDNVDYEHLRFCDLDDNGEEPGPGAECEIPDADEGCSKVFLDGSSGGDNWVVVEDPGVDPIGVLYSFENADGAITISLVDGEPVIIIADASLADVQVDVSGNVDGSESDCIALVNVEEPVDVNDPEAFIQFENLNYSYPFYIKVEANVCQ